MRSLATYSLLAVLCLTWGCSKSEEKAEAPAAPAAPEVPPHAVVTQFLEAVRVGNDKVAEGMLTELARQKTSEADLTVAPPGSPTAKFEVGATEVAENGQLAYVESRWTDVGADGKPEVNEFVWALRKDNGGWRIGGVATQPFPNMPFLQLDFENPAEMEKQTRLAEQEYQRRLNGGKPAAGDANAPGAQIAGGTVPAGTAPAGTAPATLPAGAAALPAPGTSPNNSVQNAGGFSSPTPGAVQPVSGFSSGMPAGNPVPAQAQQPQLPGTLNR